MALNPPFFGAGSPLDRSWQRCRTAGLDADSPLSPLAPNPAALADSLEKHATLVAYAQPVIEGLHPHLARSSSIALLADGRGMILRCAGDSVFLERARQLRLQPGALWSEAAMATNAIGTALQEQGPVAVLGEQHFFTRHHGLAGIAVPIAAPVGGVAGVLAIVGDVQLPHTHAAALLELTAGSIENRLVENTPDGALLLRLHASAEALGSPLEGLALWRDDGCLLAWNRRFSEFVPGEPAVGRTFASCFKQTWAALLEQGSGPGDDALALRSRDGRSCQARVDMRPALRRRPPERSPVSVPGGRQLAELGGEDPRMAIAIRRATRIAGIDIPLLIEGETGSGKEWFAQAFHQASKRRQGPFVAVNCAAIPATLIEAELFGYLDGAFTGARRLGSLGKIREADGGTLFLDEIGDMPLALQAVLLRVLETRRVVPLGGMVETAVDIALVCASHHPLQQLVSNGLFRADLFFRLSGMTVALPALRERCDFDRVVRSILAEEATTREVSVTAESFALLRRYNWPGNLRQLRNVLRLCVAMLGEDGILTPDLLPSEIAELNSATLPASRRLQAVQVQAIQATLERHRGNISAAARELGITRTTLYRKLGKDRPVAAEIA